LTVPAGWSGTELVAIAETEFAEGRYRVLAATRGDGVVASVYVPEALADDAAAELAAMLTSIEDRRAAGTSR